jgi:hypothetical protein
MSGVRFVPVPVKVVDALFQFMPPGAWRLSLMAKVETPATAIGQLVFWWVLSMPVNMMLALVLMTLIPVPLAKLKSTKTS